MKTQSRFVRTCGLVLALALVGPGLAWADGAHKADQGGNIQLGTSGGNIYNRSSAFCCSGTLGALVVDTDARQYVLSNNHVLAVTNTGTVGDPIIQPGMIDQSPVCAQDLPDTVATLTSFVPILFGNRASGPTNYVDAAIAEVVPGGVDPSGSILDIGPVSPNTLSASVGLGVQKSGRTTGHTAGVVAAVNVSVAVGYSKSCGSGGTNVAHYDGQIRITDGAFSAGGDSGSLIVENVASTPRAVGLLFAGSSTSTIANPIGLVLSELGVAMVGGTPPPPPPMGSIDGLVTDDADGTPIAGASVTTDTGQSGITDATGAYQILDVPTGTRTVIASASGYDASSVDALVNEDAATTVDFALVAAAEPPPPPPSGSQAIVECVEYSSTGGKNRDKHLNIGIRMQDDLGNPLAGVEVQILVALDSNSTWSTGTGAITDETGLARYTGKNAPNGTYVTTVTAIIGGPEFEGSTPTNSFTKGTDSAHADCRSGSSSQTSGLKGGGTPLASGGVGNAAAIQRRHNPDLFGLTGVVGTGISRDDAGRPVIEIYLDEERAGTRARIPAALEGVATRVLVTGPFVAY